jgi:hypothetical protein
MDQAKLGEFSETARSKQGALGRNFGIESKASNHLEMG